MNKLQTGYFYIRSHGDNIEQYHCPSDITTRDRVKEGVESLVSEVKKEAELLKNSSVKSETRKRKGCVRRKTPGL